jgi:hypothetical protein
LCAGSCGRIVVMYSLMYIPASVRQKRKDSHRCKSFHLPQ